MKGTAGVGVGGGWSYKWDGLSLGGYTVYTRRVGMGDCACLRCWAWYHHGRGGGEGDLVLSDCLRRRSCYTHRDLAFLRSGSRYASLTPRPMADYEE